MKNIVLSCKSITEEVESHETRTTPDLSQTKTDLSAALTQLMTCAKTHAKTKTETSVKEIADASTNLTRVMVQLVNTLTPVEEVVIEESQPSRTGQIMAEYVSQDTYSPLPQASNPKDINQLKVSR